MRIAEVIGSLTLSRAHPSLIGARYLIAVPFSLEALKVDKPDGEDLVLVDELGAAPGMRIGLSESAEAAAPFFPAKKPIDAYCACLLDETLIHEPNDQRRV